MPSMRRILLSFSLLVAAPAPLLAQTEPAGMMPDVVVTADRYPTDPSKVTGSYTVVTGEDMQKRQLRTVGDVVNYIQKLEEENPEAAAALREKFASEK